MAALAAQARATTERWARGRARRGGRRRGFSLVEILVVLVILVAGMLAITRIFPEGFVSLSQAGNITLAGALAKYNEDYLLKQQENLPDGIVGVDPNTGTIRVGLTGPDLLASRPYIDLPLTPAPQDPRYSDVNQVRRVLGEQLRVGAPATFSLGGGAETASLYRSLFSPLYSPGFMAGSSLGVVAAAGTPLQRVVFRSPVDDIDLEALRAAGPFGYGVEYSTGTLFFLSAGYDRAVKVEFTYRSSPNAPGQSIPDNCLFVAAGNPDPGVGAVRFVAFDMHNSLSQGGCTFVGMPPGAQADPGSDQVYRRLTLVSPSSRPFTADPFEYKVYDPVMGLFGFNPALSALPVPRQEGRGLTVRLDYDVDDWHIIRQDVVAPSELVDRSAAGLDRFYSVKLEVPRIKRVGDVEDTFSFLENTQTTTFEHQGLVRFWPAARGAGPRAGLPGVDLILVDLQTGSYIDSTSLQKPGTFAPPVPASADNANGEIDYDAGVIHLREFATFSPPGVPYGFPPAGLGQRLSTGGRQLRVFYRTTDDHGVATLKPHAAFRRQLVPQSLSDQQYSQYPRGGFLLLHSSESDKTVAVDYTWQDRNGGMHEEIGELHRVENQDAVPPYLGSPFPVFGWIRLTHGDQADATDTAFNPDVLPGSIRIRSVRGASVQTRVVWRQGRRWRTYQRTTLLNRGPGR